MRKMRFSWTFAAISILFVIGMGIASYLEGTFSHKQMGQWSIPFLNHGGCWADLLIMTVIVGLIGPYLASSTVGQRLVCLTFSLIITIVCHVAWAYIQPIPGHIVSPWPDKIWRFSWAGLGHAGYMTLMLGIILIFYLIIPNVPKSTLITVSVLLTFFIVPAIFQPGWYVAKVASGVGKVDSVGWVTGIIIWIIVWSATLIKLHQSKPPQIC